MQQRPDSEYVVSRSATTSLRELCCSRSLAEIDSDTGMRLARADGQEFALATGHVQVRRQPCPGGAAATATSRQPRGDLRHGDLFDGLAIQVRNSCKVRPSSSPKAVSGWRIWGSRGISALRCTAAR